MLQSLSRFLVRLFRKPASSRFDVALGVDAYKAGDYATARRELEPLANEGNLEAMLYLGFMLQRGQGVTRDPAKAAQLLLRSADAGFAWSQYTVACQYERGEDGFPQSPEKSLAYLLKAEAQGSGLALFALLDRYEAAQDYDRAVALLQKWSAMPVGASKSVAAAMRTLGHCYSYGLYGRKLPLDDDKAFALYEKAAAAGDRPARIIVDALGGPARSQPTYARTRAYLQEFVAALPHSLMLSSCNGVVQTVRERSLELDGCNLILRYVSETTRAGAAPESRQIELFLPLLFPEKREEETRLYWFEQTDADGKPMPRTAVVYLEPWTAAEKAEAPLNTRVWDELAFPLWPAGEHPDMAQFENHEFIQALRHLRRLLGIDTPASLTDD